MNHTDEPSRQVACEIIRAAEATVTLLLERTAQADVQSSHSYLTRLQCKWFAGQTQACVCPNIDVVRCHRWTGIQGTNQQEYTAEISKQASEHLR